MQSLARVFIGVGVLLVTSCSTSQPETSEGRIADAASSFIQSDGAERAVHSHTSGHHGGPHHSSDRVRHRWGSNGHQHGHGHSAEDQDADNSKKMAIGDKVPDFEVTFRA